MAMHVVLQSHLKKWPTFFCSFRRVCHYGQDRNAKRRLRFSNGTSNSFLSFFKTQFNVDLKTESITKDCKQEVSKNALESREPGERRIK